MHRWRQWLDRGLNRGLKRMTGRAEQDLDRELRDHLELEEREQQDGGFPVAEARIAARRAFGNTTLLKEEAREMWGWNWCQTLAQDLRYAARALKRNPAFAAAAVLSLALGIGANTAIFALLDAVLLKSLPVPEPERLVQLEAIHNGKGFNYFSWPVLERLRAGNHAFAPLFAWSIRRMNVDLGGGAEPLTCVYVTGNYYQGLGVPAAMGRTLLPEDDRPGAPPVAVIGYRAWQARFAGDPAVLGRTVKMESLPVTVVGVLPAWFLGTEVGSSPEIAVPVTLQPLLMRERPMLARADAQFLRVMGRLAEGVSEPQARAQLAAQWPLLTAELDPDARLGLRQLGIRLTDAGTGLSQLRVEFSRPLFVLLALVGLVLLMACVNVANLLLARAAARQKEMAVRLAIGAGRRRLVRQLLTESLLLAAISSALGTLLAYWGVRGLVRLLSINRSAVVLNLRPDARVLAFTAAVTLLTGVLFGLAPALRATRVELDATLRSGGRAPGARRRLMQALVVGQVAVCLLLLTGAGLFIRTLNKLLTADAGFTRDGVLLVSISPARAGYRDASLAHFYEQVLDRVSALPGVRAASLARYPPLTGGGGTFFSAATVSVDGRPPTAAPGNVYLNEIGPRYFETMGAALLAGREFSRRDGAGVHGQEGPRVVVVSQALARAFFRDGGAVGHRMAIGLHDAPAEVIGVVRDMKYETLREAPHMVVYEPYTQSLANSGSVYLTVRGSRGAAPLGNEMGREIRRELRLLAGPMPVEVLTLTEWMDQFLVQERLVALLSAAFGMLALVLAAVGLYGVMAYTVARRTGEIGIRMALGAPVSRVRWLVMRETLLLAAAGVVVGVPAALAAGRLVSKLLFGLTPGDPLTLAAASLLLAGEAVVAGYVPARRASRVDPMLALRYE